MVQTCAVVYTATAPDTPSLNGLLLPSFDAMLITPVKVPTAAASNCTAQLVVSPGARVMAPKLVTKLYPAGNATAPRVRAAVPPLRTVSVLVTGAPTGVLPKFTLLTPSTAAVPFTSTWMSGPDTSPPTRSTRIASATK